jgi:hypothetical protein
MKLLVFLLLMVCASCSVFTGFKRKTFTYNEKNESQAISLRVPAGYDKEQIIDSGGSKEQWYYYDNGAVLYFAQTVTAKEYQPIDSAVNKPSLHLGGGLLYKGFGQNALYWREYRLDSLRFGYKNVPYSMEARFDSAVNYAGYRKVKK